MVASDQHRTAGDAVPRRVSPPKLIRAAAALLVGLAITFTGTLHSSLGFNHGLAIVAFALFAAAHLFAWWYARTRNKDVVSLILAIASIVAAIVLPMTHTAAGLAVVIAAWALMQGLLEFIGAATRQGGRQDATILGALGMLLSVVTLLVFRDTVAIIGFFGAYALIVGVFLGIAAFDVRDKQQTPLANTERTQHD